MQTVRTTTDSLTLLTQAGGAFIIHFGFFKIENENSYYCYEDVYRTRPTLDEVNAHIKEVNVQYCISEDEWERNEGRVQNVQ